MDTRRVRLYQIVSECASTPVVVTCVKIFHMNTIAENLKKLGFEEQFQEAVHIEDLETFEMARVVAVHVGNYNEMSYLDKK